MFNIASLIGLISRAPTIIEGVMTLINEIEAGYNKAKADGHAEPIEIFENILAELVKHKGTVASAVLGPEPAVTPSGTIIPIPQTRPSGTDR